MELLVHSGKSDTYSHLMAVLVVVDFDLMAKAVLTDCDPVELSKVYCEYLTSNFQQELGKGCFGTVFLGKDENLKGANYFAVKRLHFDLSDDSSYAFAQKTFKQEINVLQRFRHPNIVRLFGISFSPGPIGTQFLVYELGDQLSLKDVLKNSSNSLQWSQRLSILLDVSTGLNFLHTGGNQSKYAVWHRDLKSANVIIMNNHSAKIIDCGLAKFTINEDSPIFTSISSSLKLSSGDGVLGT
mmetsp:Transcript_4055/g.9213  ORF Transcript_4055/g.9213 Transcript_4055/m.9213 type:complete len:241 (+) Transcript_4055:721-1443(+)